MDTLMSIKTFRQVIESGSFVAAAERLDMSTAMVSKHVMHIEKRLGVRLLNRNPRTLSLTEPAPCTSSAAKPFWMVCTRPRSSWGCSAPRLAEPCE